MGRMTLFKRSFRSLNEELSQALIRLLFYVVIYLYYFSNVLFFATKKPSEGSLIIILVLALYALLQTYWVLKSPAPNPFRRVLAIVLDISAITFGVYLMEWSSFFIYPFYLWVIAGNGMRFGFAYFLTAMFLAAFEFGLILIYHPFWITNHQVGIGLMVILVLLPLFFFLMLQRLQLVNSRLREQLDGQEEDGGVNLETPLDKTMFAGKSLFRRTFIFIVGIVLVVTVFFNLTTIHSQNEALIDVMASKAKTMARSIALVTADAMVTEDESFIVEHVQKVLEDDDEIVYTLITKKEEYSIYHDLHAWSILQEVPSILQELQLREEAGKIVQSKLNDEEVYHYSYPVRFSGIEWGWVAIGYSLEQYHASQRAFYRKSVVMLLVILVASVLFSYIVARWLVRPILLLNYAAKQVASGDLNAKVDVISEDEIGELANSFNHMVSTLRHSDAKLRRSNDELEERVNERTEALNKLNLVLDERVKEEMLKRVEQEQMLIQQSRFAAMGEMIGNIAHQWRQPLNALGLLLQNIEYAYEEEMLDDAYIARIVEKGNRLTRSMSQTIDDFRNFFKPNRESEVFAISSALSSTMELVRSSLENNMISIEEEIDPEVCIDGFASEFSQVLMNLLNNAKDALIENRSEKRSLWIRVIRGEETARIEIEDNAGGIPEAILNKVFEPYFTTKEEGKGTGIGLYMSKTIIESNMKGSLSISNTSQGARFTIVVNTVACQGEADE